jgi:hypothetical protein
MFYVQATRQEPPGVREMNLKEMRTRFPCEAYVTWDSRHVPVFLGIDNPPKPVPMEEAERLLSQCEKVHGWMYDHNLRIVPA